ncbi:YceD family protein [Mumia sp. Pv 4-285]|uniref:YceD family protein n=1 Tax=Mumia qirimensis TaxID=3234852 RepID=UPI00351CFFFD
MPEGVRVSTLDSRAPYVLDTREIARRPGTQRELDVSEKAPAGMRVDMLGVPEGSDVALELRLESVMEGILVTGTASVHTSGECVRCLKDIDGELTVDLQELYVYDDEDEDDDISRLEGDLVDLEPVLRDAVVLALPHNPLCVPDCPGLCPECGVRLADDPEHTHGDAVDPRWSALSQMLEGNDRPVGGSEETGRASGPDEE